MSADRDHLAARRLIYENVAKGYMEIVGEDENGEPLFRLTEAGHQRVEGLIGESAVAGEEPNDD